MLSILDPFRGMDFLSILLRLFLALLCGTVIGLERSAKNRPAGFRTHVLVCIAATTASLTGHYLYLVRELPSDMTRLAAQIITGLGFLGAGTILVTKSRSIKGLTTAAGLWTTGIIGLAIGAGFYEGAALCTGLVFLTEFMLGELVKKIRRDVEFAVQLCFTQKNALDQVMRYCKDRNLVIRKLKINSMEDAGTQKYVADIMLHGDGNVKVEELMAHIRAVPGVESAEL